MRRRNLVALSWAYYWNIGDKAQGRWAWISFSQILGFSNLGWNDRKLRGPWARGLTVDETEIVAGKRNCGSGRIGACRGLLTPICQSTAPSSELSGSTISADDPARPGVLPLYSLFLHACNPNSVVATGALLLRLHWFWPLTQHGTTRTGNYKPIKIAILDGRLTRLVAWVWSYFHWKEVKSQSAGEKFIAQQPIKVSKHFQKSNIWRRTLRIPQTCREQLKSYPCVLVLRVLKIWTCFFLVWDDVT